MSDTLPTYNKHLKKTEQGKPKSTPQAAIAVKSERPGWLKYILLSVIIVVTFWCYHYSLGNEFTNWDDDRFVTQNDFIKSLSPANLNVLLFHNVKVDNYVPLTMVSYAVNYHFSGLSPQGYYFTNIILHILNCCLMFFLILILLNAMEKNEYGIFKWKEWMAFFCTLTFAVHPMHVESVSWMAERKDVLYTFFYFAGLLSYVCFITVEKKNRLWLLLTFVSFLFSLLSKPMAIVFPFSLLAIDALLKRDKSISIKELSIEKIPFLLVSVIVTIATYHFQKVSGTFMEQESYSFFQRILFASYNFYMYIVKAFIPIPLSAFYPFPTLAKSQGTLPVIYYLSPFIALSAIAIPVYFSCRPLLRRAEPKKEGVDNNFRLVLFGIGFYFFNMVIVSQIVHTGLTVIADRYSYVCYLGIFFPVTYFINKTLEKRKAQVIKYGLAAICAYILFLAILCQQRTRVWHNSETLWTDVIEQYPHKVSIAYFNLGHYYMEQNNAAKADSSYRELTMLGIKDPGGFFKMGLFMYNNKRYESALYYYTEVIKTDSSDPITVMDRGNAYSALGKFDKAKRDYQQSFRLNPHSEDLLGNMASNYFNAQQFDSAIICYNRAVQINPANPWNYHYRGITELYKDAIKPALSDFMQTLILAPHDSECMYYLSITYNHIRDFNSAYKYAQMAQSAGYQLSNEYMGSLKDSLRIK